MHTFVDGELLTAGQLNGNFSELTTTTGNRLDSLESDSDWIPITGNGNWSNSSLSLRRRGRVVTFTGRIWNGSSISVNNHAGIATIPAEYRPGRDIFVAAALRKPSATPNYVAGAVVQISYTTGNLSAFTSDTSDGIFFSTSWVI